MRFLADLILGTATSEKREEKQRREMESEWGEDGGALLYALFAAFEGA
jgi:hypothetical protein